MRPNKLEPVTREAVEWAYRMILGRPPENEAVIGSHMNLPSVEALRLLFQSSLEATGRIIQRPYAAPQFVADLTDCGFYHSTDLPGFGLQEGPWDLRGKFRDYMGEVRCTGKRVLDVGCASGFLSFSAEQDGATEVVSFDMDDARRQHLLPFYQKDYYRNHDLWLEMQTAYIKTWHRAYWLTHRLIDSKAQVSYGDVYDLPDALGQFDIVIVGAILEHLSDPIRALASIARRASDTIVINTDLLETEDRIARFDGNADRPEFDFVFWTYSLGTYRHVLRMLGFDIIRTMKRDFRYTQPEGMYPRTAIVARRMGTNSLGAT
jgi:SAM-dependent methyltransferase